MKIGGHRGLRSDRMSLALYGWGSNLHGQLGQPHKKLYLSEPTLICSDATDIIGASGSNAIVHQGDTFYLYGFCRESSHPTASYAGQKVEWKPNRIFLGQDEVLGYLDPDGYLCQGMTGQRRSVLSWTSAAVDLTNRVMTISGMLYVSDSRRGACIPISHL